MDSGAFSPSFGMRPGDFGRAKGPIESDDGFVYEAWEARKSPACPRCGSADCIIKDRYLAEIRLRSDILKTEVLMCYRIKYACKGCGKTFTAPLKGAMVGRSVTHLERASILAELNQGDTFERVARAHGISKTEAVRIFDDAYPKVRRKALPKILLIDEFRWAFTNAKMEAGNDVAQTTIDAAYGYHSFECFLLMRWNRGR